MAGTDQEQRRPKPEQVAGYVADLARQLGAVTAGYPELTHLTYLLELVQAEAELRSRPTG
jgi:hypothetical protein